MSKIKRTLIILFVALGLSSCDLLTQVAQMANFANCTFDFNSINKIQMLGVNLSKGMTKIVSLNGKQVISTTMSNSINVPAKSKNTITIPVTTDLFQLFSGESADAILNLAFKLAGASSDPVKLGLQVKPYITINNQQLSYPNYITINKTLQ